MAPKIRAPLTERLAQELIPDRGKPKPSSHHTQDQNQNQLQGQRTMASFTTSTGGTKRYGRKKASAAAQRALFEESYTTKSSTSHQELDAISGETKSREHGNNEPAVSLPQTKPKTSNGPEAALSSATQQVPEDVGIPRKSSGVLGPAISRSARKSPISSDNIRHRPSEQQPQQRGRSLRQRRRAPVIAGIEQALEGLTIDELPPVFSASSSGSPPIIGHVPEGRSDLVPLVEASNLKKVETFHNWAAQIIKTYNIDMVGEGAFGQVFKVTDRTDVSPRTNQHQVRELGGCILKIIPIKPRNSKAHQSSTAQSIATEIKLLKRMDAVHGFTRYRDVYVLQGRMDLKFIDAWQAWKSVPANESEIDPTKSSRNTEKQIWAVLEMDDAGRELESFRKVSAFQAYDVFWSLTLILALAEEQAEFEHRDLHISNVCVKSRELDGRTDISENLNSTMTTPPPVLFGLSGLRTTIIDYTLSRALVDDTPAFGPVPNNLFDGEGGHEEHLWQWDTYRR